MYSIVQHLYCTMPLYIRYMAHRYYYFAEKHYRMFFQTTLIVGNFFIYIQPKVHVYYVMIKCEKPKASILNTLLNDPALR